MAEATLLELKTFGGDSIVGLPDAQLQIFLDDAMQTVAASGILTSHARFAELQRYFAMHLMDVANLLCNPLSGTVEGIQFTLPGGSSGNTPAITWLDLYNTKRAEIV